MQRRSGRDSKASDMSMTSTDRLGEVDHSSTSFPRLPVFILGAVAHLFCALIAMGVPTVSAVVLTVGAMPIVGGGAVLYAWISGTRHFDFIELVGAGFATATALQAVVSFFLGELGLRGLIDDYVLMAFFVISLVVFRGRHLAKVSVASPNHRTCALIVLVSLVGYYAWAPLIWPYILTLIALLVLTALVTRQRQRTAWITESIAVVVPPVGAVAVQLVVSGILDLPRAYLYLGLLTDNVFDESLSWSVARSGYSTNPFFDGGELVGYQLANAWAGSLTDALNVQPFTVLAAFGPILSIVATLAIAVSLVKRLGSRAAWIAVVLVGLQGSFGELFPLTEPPRLQQLLTTSWVLLAVVFLERWLETRSTVLMVAVFGLAVATSMAKTQLAPIVLGLLLINTLYLALNDRSLRHAWAGLMTLFLSLLTFPWMSERYFGARSAPWSINLDGPTMTRWLIPILIVLALRTLFPIFMIGSHARTDNHRFVRVGLLGLPASAAYALTHDTNALRHTIVVILVVGSIVAVPMVEDALSRVGKLASTVIFGVGVLLGAFVFYARERAIIINLPQDHWSRRIGFEYPTQSQLAAVIAIGLVVGLITALFQRRRPIFKVLFASLIVAAVATNSGSLLAWTARTELRGFIRLEKGESWPSNGQRLLPILDTSEWVRKNTNKDVVIASNTLCKALPSVGVVPDFPADWDCQFRNMSSWVAAFSQRQTYLDGPWQGFIFPDMLDTANQRYRDSILFATNNDPNSHARMIRDGVDFFVVDLGQTTLRDWEPRATIRYQDDHYAVVELNE